MKKILLFIPLISLFNAAFGQQAMHSAGNLQLHTGASMEVLGNFTNTSTAALVNNGDLYISGNIINDQASMATGAGTVYLKGNTAQSINGLQYFHANNFVSNNAAGITLNSNLRIAGVHTYTNGMLMTAGSSNLIYEAGSSHTGSSDARHVIGWVKKIGNTNFVFPVGNVNFLRPVSLSTLTANSEFDCHYYNPTQNISSVTTPVRMVKANEYWQINKISGGNASVTLNWDHSKIPMDNILLADIVAGLYTGGSWTNLGGIATGSTGTVGSVTSVSTPTFNSFSLAYKTYPVPLKLISFNVKRERGKSYVYWTSEDEQHVDHFEVERSYDAADFIKLGSVSARNSGQKEQYDFTDPAALDGTAYYRLRMIDDDGHYTFSKTVSVFEKVGRAASFLALSPAKNAMIVLNRSGVTGIFEYKIFKSSGELLIRGTVLMNANTTTVLPLPAATAAGIYILEMGNRIFQYRQQVLVE